MVNSSSKSELCIWSFGRELKSEYAHWGRGSRDLYIIHYVLSGEGYFNGNKVQAGEGFLIKPYEMHEYHSSENKPWQYFWISANGFLADKMCSKYLDANENGVFKYDFKSKLEALIDEVLSCDKSIGELLAISYFLKIMSWHEEVGVERKKSNAHIESAKRYITNNFHRAISITEIADALFIDDRYLYNLFIKYEGVSPKKYLNIVRLENACKLLKNSYYSITEIAVSVGFTDVLSFSRFFSKSMKMSPSEYRKSSV